MEANHSSLQIIFFKILEIYFIFWFYNFDNIFNINESLKQMGKGQILWMVVLWQFRSPLQSKSVIHNGQQCQMSNNFKCQAHWNLQISVFVFVFNSESAPSPSAAEEKMPRFCWLLILLLNKFGLSDQIRLATWRKDFLKIISWFKNSGMFLFWNFYPPCVCFCGTVSWLFHYFDFDFKITRGTKNVTGPGNWG